MSALAPAGALMSGSAPETEGCGMADAIVKLKRWAAFVARCQLIKDHDQIFLTLNGHYWPPGRTSLNASA